MTNISLDLSGKIDSTTVEVCEKVSACAASMEIPFFVVGAAARDLILTEGYGVRISRMTQDIDFAIQVSNWKQYESLMSKMLSIGDFEKTRMTHRLSYQKRCMLDLVPFGSLAGKDHSITFPPPGDTKMTVLGFDDAHRHAQLIRLRAKPVLEIPFASLRGLVILKLISWNDDPVRRGKDAQDVDLILRHYADAGNHDRLILEHADLYEIEGMDYLHAGVRFLGRDIAAIASSETKKALLEILDCETDINGSLRLVEDMLKGKISGDEGFEETLKLVSSLRGGIKDGTAHQKLFK